MTYLLCMLLSLACPPSSGEEKDSTAYCAIFCQEGCCCADWNEDGETTQEDFDLYIDDFFSENLCADINADGQVSPDDLSDYITVYYEAIQHLCG